MKELKGDYRLILPDARGHGDSEKPHDIHAYSPERTTGDLVAVLNDLSVETANVWGYSGGGLIGFQIVRHHPSRFSSFIIGGMSPYPLSETQEQMRAHRLARYRVGAEKGPEAVIACREKTLGRVLSDEEKQQIRSNDYTAMYAAYTNMNIWSSTDDLLPRIAVPCLLYAGENDPWHDGAKEAANHIPDARFISLPGLNHVAAAYRIDLLAHMLFPQVKRFLSKVTK